LTGYAERYLTYPVHGAHAGKGRLQEQGLCEAVWLLLAQRVYALLREAGQLSDSQAELVRQRVRYFSDGAVLGSKAFVEGIFEAQRERFSPKRKQGAKRITESETPFYPKEENGKLDEERQMKQFQRHGSLDGHDFDSPCG
jgi:hypothetical protein